MAQKIKTKTLKGLRHCSSALVSSDIYSRDVGFYCTNPHPLPQWQMLQRNFVRKGIPDFT